MKQIIYIIAIITLFTGCVTKSTYVSTLKELHNTKSSLSHANDKIFLQNEQIAAQKITMKKNSQKIAQTQDELAKLNKNKANLQIEYEKTQNLLDASQSKLEKMAQIEAETKKRNEIYARFVSKLQKMIEAGKLSVSIEKGRMVINLPSNVLFATAHAHVNAEGQKVLKQIASVLKEFKDRQFQVEGYTDNVPIKSAQYPSNWELSTARALNVVHLMIDEGVNPKNLSAAGYGEYQPRADNATPEGRKLNRRIEIIMLPNLEILSNELPKLVK
ncbi:OmpA family protein [Sulfurimonas sp.]